MNLYTIVTNDEYELPIKCDLKVKEVAEFFGFDNTQQVRNIVFKPRKKSKYKVIVSGKYEYDRKMYLKKYSMAHDRTEYFKERWKKKKGNEHKQNNNRSV